LTAVTPQGSPDQRADRPRWLLVVAVGIAGIALGYLLGGGGSSDMPLPAGETTTTTPSDSEPTTTTRPAPTTVPPEPSLAERVPGLEGTLFAQMARWETLPFTGPRLIVWPAGRPSHLVDDIPITGIASPNADGGLLAGFGPSARGPALYVGPQQSMRPALFDVSSYAWHVTDTARLAWLGFTDEPGRYALRVAEVAPNGFGPWLSPGVPVTTVGDVRLVAWGEWGFLLATHFSPEVGENPEVIFLDPDGTERWRREAGNARVSATGDVLLIGSYREVTDFSEVRLVAASSLVAGVETEVEWLPDWTVAAAWAPDSTRLALAVWIEETDEYRIEVRTASGDLLVSAFAPAFFPAHAADRSISRSGDESFLHEYWSREIAWSPDGRFVILAGWEPIIQRGRVLFYDTIERRLHELDFPTPVHRAVVHAP
jgi:hypothetical protein